MRELKVEIWSDLVCPWCLLGYRRFELALNRFEHREDVRVRWRAFELDPAAPKQSKVTILERMQRDLGVSKSLAKAQIAQITDLATEVGLNYRVADAVPVNSFDAHRLQAYAETIGVGTAVRDRLMRGYAEETANLGSMKTLIQIAAEAGLDPEKAAQVLESSDYAETVRSDEKLAQQYGLSGVPSFVFADQYLVSGAQSVDTFLDLLWTAWTETDASTSSTSPQTAPMCTKGECG